MQIRGTVNTIPQCPVFNHRERRASMVQSKRAGATAVAPSLCTSAFLTQKIQPITSDESKVALYGFNVTETHKWIAGCCRRFLETIGMKYDYKCNTRHTKPIMLLDIIEYFEKKIEPLGLSLSIRKEEEENDNEVLKCVVYRYGSEMELSIPVFYCCPAEYLSPEGADLYKHFIKYVSDRTRIDIGVKEYTDNYYLGMLSDIYQDTCCQEEDDVQFGMVKHYCNNGKFRPLLDEIDALPVYEGKYFKTLLEEYRHKCPSEENDLVECMIDGIDVVKDLNRHWFDFDPDNDGMPNANGYVEDGNSSSGVMASAILYSENDGLCDEMLDMINGDADSGLNITTWNICQYLTPKLKKSQIKEFVRCKDLVRDFKEWLDKFYNASGKFDRYGEPEECTEQ